MRFSILLFAAVCALGQNAPGQSPDEKAWQVLDRGVHDSNPLKRRQSVLAMSLLHPQPRPVALIEPALDDKDTGVREAACATLGEIKSRTSIPKLQMALADAAPEVIFAAAKALYGMDDPIGRDVLMAVLQGEQADASGFVSSSIRDMKLKLHDRKALLMIGVTSGVGFAGPFGMAVPMAEGVLKDSQASGKTVAVLLLATDNSADSLPALKEALADKNWTVRVAAARAIGIRDAVNLYDNLVTLLSDKREEVQLSAAAALIRLRQPEPAPSRIRKKTLTVK
ncbi:MAG TPA: HEAT repeat domain-containing protein [Bryobacteraceae bacterium]|jgi:HEAT repeat protein